jgi:hypothetical protein
VRINFISHKSNPRLAAMVLLALCLIHMPGRIAAIGTTNAVLRSNPDDDQMITLASSVLGGVARGQTMRFTLFNPSEPDSVSSLRAQVKLFDAQGRVIDERAEVAIRPGEFRSFNFNRNDIPLAGEEGTGRLEVRGTILVMERRDISEARNNQIPTLVELVDNNTGATTAALSSYSPMLVVAKNIVGDDQMITLASSVLGGVARGQTMRFTLFKPSEPDSVSSLRAQVKLFDTQGRVIAESAEVAIRPGEFRSFNFNRNEIPLAGEEGTGRLEVRGTIRVVEGRDISEARGNQILTFVELVDNRTGVGQAITTAISPYVPIIIA